MNGFRSRGVGGGFLGGLFSGGGGAHDDAQQLNQDAVVNNRRYVLSDSNAERLGPNGDGRREEEEPRDISEIDSQAATSTSYQGASLSEIDSRASTETTAQSTDASSSEEATANSFVSGLGCLTSSSGGSDQGYGYDLDDDDDDDSNGPPPVSPAGASLVQGQVNGVGFGLSPIANVNATHVHNASMASPGIGGSVEDNVPSLSNEPSPDMRVPSNTANDTVSTSQLQDLLEENALATNEGNFPLPDEEGREEESASTADIDSSTWEPTESALAMASDAPWSEGQRFNRGMPIFAIRLVLSKPCYERASRESMPVLCMCRQGPMGVSSVTRGAKGIAAAS